MYFQFTARITELENKLYDKELQLKQTNDENRTLGLELKRIQKSLESSHDSVVDLPSKTAAMDAQMKKYKERMRQYQVRHDEDQKSKQY